MYFIGLNNNPGKFENLGANSFGACIFLLEIRIVGELLNFKVVDGILLDKEMNRLIWCSRNRIVGYEIHCIDDTINTVISLSAQE